ncbi:hypothetical protein [Kaistia sp. MMO-174]|uniref:hypothetical protein n=1 Tax=Kaistia sp. MMO-174 TaxID=3081256 RepID=UPI0030193B18
MSGDEIEHAAHLWLQGFDTARIASVLFLREAAVYRNLSAIKARAKEILESTPQ